MQSIFENTTRSLNMFAGFISGMFKSGDENIIVFCRTEYGTDWQWAYHSWQKQGRFPNHLDTMKEVA